MLEYSLIKQHRPRFNVRLVDDKSYPYLAVTLVRRVAQGHGDARPQAQGDPVLRALRPRLRHPRHPRRAAAHLPHPHLLRRQAAPPRAAGQAVPAVPHREVLRALRGRDRARGVPAAGRGADGLPRRRDPAGARPPRGRDARPRPTPWSSSRPGASGTASPRSGGPSSASRWWRTATSPSTSSGIAEDDLEASVQVFLVRRGRVVGRTGFLLDKVMDLSRVRDRRRGDGAALRRRAGDGLAQAGAACRPCPTTPGCTGRGSARCGAPRSSSACPGVAPSASSPSTVHPQRRRGPGPAPAPAGQ